MFRFHLWPGEISGGNPSWAAVMEGVKINILHGSVKLKCVCNFFSSIENTNYANAFHGVFLTSTDEEGSFVHPGKKGNPCGHKGKRRDKCCDMTQNIWDSQVTQETLPPPPLPSSLFENTISPKFLTFPACFFAPLSNFYFLLCRRRYLGDPKTAAGWVFIFKTLHRLVSFLHVHNIYLHSPQLPARSLCAYVKQLRSDASTLRRGKHCACVLLLFSSFFLLRFAFLRGQGCILLQQRRSKKKKNLFPSFSPGRALSV